ncbi:hypothetical protein BC830DRAFT_1081903 [Chytriomyces sp. MP71]|nr:hypothetical protein BC830DRAFT_1081903 [Chytriomyces sp. MP71]
MTQISAVEDWEVTRVIYGSEARDALVPSDDGTTLTATAIVRVNTSSTLFTDAPSESFLSDVHFRYAIAPVLPILRIEFAYAPEGDPSNRIVSIRVATARTFAKTQFCAEWLDWIQDRLDDMLALPSSEAIAFVVSDSISFFAKNTRRAETPFGQFLVISLEARRFAKGPLFEDSAWTGSLSLAQVISRAIKTPYFMDTESRAFSIEKALTNKQFSANSSDDKGETSTQYATLLLNELKPDQSSYPFVPNQPVLRSNIDSNPELCPDREAAYNSCSTNTAPTIFDHHKLSPHLMPRDPDAPLQRLTLRILQHLHNNMDCDNSRALAIRRKFLEASMEERERVALRHPWIPRYVKALEEETVARLWTVQNASICPKCGVGIERTEGCSHITCSECGCHYCYDCGNKYDVNVIYRHDCQRRKQEAVSLENLFF